MIKNYFVYYLLILIVIKSVFCQQIESYKILVGDTLRLECPQMNPTWFYRNLETNIEDIIVTRHGIVNVEYKQRITLHQTLKHKIIFINKINVDDDGMYSCLFTKTIKNINSDDEDDIIIVQERQLFNVSVYSLIDGFNMNIKPLRKQSDLILRKNIFEITENTLTVRENDEVSVVCTVERSKPVAQINFLIIDSNKKIKINKKKKRSLISITTTPLSVLQSESPLLSYSSKIISVNRDIIKNDDKTYKNIYTTNLKVNPNDHGKQITCSAENTLSDQKWENHRTLNVLFAPICKDQENYQYFIGINQTITIECRIKNANPNHVNYEWYFTNNKNIIDYSNIDINKNNNKDVNNNNNNNLNKNSFISKIKIKPTNINDFGIIKCKASNDIGTTNCNYELKLGGIPNPPHDCVFTQKNSSAIIFCQVGYHQGDPDIYCYLLRKSDNGVYKEHTRSRDACSFIVNDVPDNKLNEFWIYTSNKFGHNKESGVYLTIGEHRKEPVSEGSGSKTFIFIGSVCGGTLLLIIACCICFKMRKSLQDDNDSYYDNDANNNGKVNTSNTNEYIEKTIKQTRDYNSSYDESESKDNEKMLKDHKKYFNNYNKKNNESDDESKINNKKFDGFKYDTNLNNFVSYFDNNKPKTEIIENKSINKKKFSFLNNNNNKSSVLDNNNKKSIIFNKNNRYDKEEIDEKDDNYERPRSKLLDDLNDKLFKIAAGGDITGVLTNVELDDEIYSLTKNKLIPYDKDLSSNTLSTNLQSDSSTSNSTHTKMVTFSTSAHSLNINNNENNKQDISSPLRSVNNNKPQLSTFGGRASPNNIYSTIKKTNKTLNDEKYLSNLCEDIEVTVNGDYLCDESTTSSIQCESNLNSDSSTTSSVGIHIQSKNYHYSVKNITNKNEINSNNQMLHHHHHQHQHQNTASRQSNERINDYNYNHRRPSTNRPNDDYSIRKSVPKTIGVLV